MLSLRNIWSYNNTRNITNSGHHIIMKMICDCWLNIFKFKLIKTFENLCNFITWVESFPSSVVCIDKNLLIKLPSIFPCLMLIIFNQPWNNNKKKNPLRSAALNDNKPHKRIIGCMYAEPQLRQYQVYKFRETITRTDFKELRTCVGVCRSNLITFQDMFSQYFPRC